MNAVGKNLKQLRQREKLTQDALAERLHVTRQAVSSWETGKTQPDIETLTALAEALGADVRELIYGPGRRKDIDAVNGGMHLWQSSVWRCYSVGVGGAGMDTAAYLWQTPGRDV